MAEEFSTDVLICGAGAAGLTLAIDLARRGVRFRLIEKLEDAFRGSRGKGIQPRTQEVFEDLGILDRVAAAGGIYPVQRSYGDDGSTTDTPMEEDHAPTPAEPYGRMLLVPQFLTEGVMRDRLAELGHRPQFGCELMGFEQDAAGITARLDGRAGPETLRVRYLVGGDGGRSFVRHALGIAFPGKTLGLRAMVADVALTGLGGNAWHRFHEDDMDRRVSLCPLPGTDLFQIQAPIPMEGEFDLSAEGLNAFVANRTGRDDIAIEAVSWASAFTMNARLADQYRVGRAFLMGDAAHTHPPTGGQGLNTSVQDAYNLGWKLAAVLSEAPERLLDTYEAERRPVAAAMLGLATKLLDAAKRGDMRRGREVHQLDLGYAGSPLAFESPSRCGGVFAGDRAPDATIRGAGGRAARLFDLFAGPHWTALVYMDRIPPGLGRPNLRIHAIGPGSEFGDSDGQFQQAYGVAAGDVVLVRPEVYIGAIVSLEERRALQAYLATVGLSDA